jgi:hypothetical protein
MTNGTRRSNRTTRQGDTAAYVWSIPTDADAAAALSRLELETTALYTRIATNTIRAVMSPLPAFPGIGHVAKAATGYAYVPIEWARTWDHPCRPVTIGVPTARVAGNKPQSIVRALPDYGVVTTWKTDQRTATNKAGDCVDPHSGIRCPDYGVAS